MSTDSPPKEEQEDDGEEEANEVINEEKPGEKDVDPREAETCPEPGHCLSPKRAVKRKRKVSSFSSDADSSPHRLEISLPSGSKEKPKGKKKRKQTVLPQCLASTSMGFESEIDKSLDLIADKNKLTAFNIKSIIRNVLQDPGVVDMAKSMMMMMEDDSGLEVQPKLTRAKVKELAAQSSAHHEEGQEEGEGSVTLFGVDVGEDDDEDEDNEYVPADEEEEEEEDEACEGEDGSSSFSTNKSEHDEESLEGKSFDDLISCRTRSKHHIVEAPTDTLEFPDVTSDLYGSQGEVDEDWGQFLNSLFEDHPSKMLDEDEKNDPEYNVFEDISELDDPEDMRDDKAVKISKKEFNCLISNEQDERPVQVKNEIPIEWSNLFNEDQVRLLHHQMGQHVQLLSQMYLLTKQSKTLHPIAQTTRSYINEVNRFASGKECSVFYANNLREGVRVIDDNPIGGYLKLRTSCSWRLSPVPEHLRPVFADHPSLFFCPKLLPECGFYDMPEPGMKSKVAFTLAEDHLIALGLDQFKAVESTNLICYKHIRQLLVPIKSEQQIRNRVKNLRRRSVDGNPISYYIANGHSPSLPSEEVTDSNHFQTTYSDVQQLPVWLRTEMNRRNPGSVPKIKPVKPRTPRKAHNMSPFKQAYNIIKKYKYLSKLPVIRAKSEQNHTNRKSEPDPNNNADLPKANKPEESNGTCGEAVELPDEDEDEEEVEEVDVPENSDSEGKEGRENEDNNMDQMDGSKEDYEEDGDNESDLAALMMASSTITSSRMRSRAGTAVNDKKESKKSLNVKQRESTIKLLADDWEENDPDKSKKDQILADYYLNRVGEVLKNKDEFALFLSYLSEFHRNRLQPAGEAKSLKTLYTEIESILLKANAREVCDEFVLFLNANEAQECGKMFEYLHWKRFKSFVRKLEIYSGGDNNVLVRLHKSLSQLKQNEANLDKKKLRNTVNKVLNGHPYLMHEFSSLFLDEKPSEHLLAQDEDFDEVVIVTSDEDEPDIGSSEKSADRNQLEGVSLPMTCVELKYGTNECPCNLCHQTLQAVKDNQSSQVLTRHCISCSLRFFGGKVYLVQGHKTRQQPALIKYLDNEDDKEGQKEAATEESPSESGSKVEARNWTFEDDKMLLQLCQAKVVANEASTLVKEMFEEAASQLNRSPDAVMIRFNLLMDMIKEEARDDTDSDFDEPEVTRNNMSTDVA